MATKYQVFVSSTYEDLKGERDVVIRAILEMGHIPVGMEMFSAADEEQWRIIARHIEESDYYCVIVAHRYGSLSDGSSYTRKEYEHAAACGVPVLGFVIDDAVSWPPEMVDRKPADMVALNEFKALVKSKPVSFWKSTDDLYGKVSIALAKTITANPREGWVRASEIADPEVTRELTRLSAENSDLRHRLNAATESREADKADELKKLLDRLMRVHLAVQYKYASTDKEWSSATKTYASYFYILAPSLSTEITADAASKELAMHIKEDSTRSWWTAAQNQVRELLSDFMAFGLVAPSKRRHAVADTGGYWSLTDLGHRLHTHMRLAMIENRESSDSSGPPESGTADDGAAKKTTAKKTAAKKTTARPEDA